MVRIAVALPALLASAGLVCGVAAEPRVVDARFGVAEPLPEMNLHFQRREGWIGGDGCYSVALAPELTLWLFSDTLVGSVNGAQRERFSLVNNSVAIQRGDRTRAQFEFFVASTESGTPTALVVPVDGRGFYWLQAAHFDGQQLFLFLTQVEKTAAQGAFGFRQIGQWLGVVANPLSPPTQWRIEQRQLPFVEFSERLERAFGAAVFADEEFVYLYGRTEPRDSVLGGRAMIVARAPHGSLAEFSAWRFHDGNEWQSDVAAAAPAFLGFATEASVTRLPRRSVYAIVYSESGLSPNIVARVARSPAGPWSPATVIYRCPDADADKQVFCYAAKAHPQLAIGDELIISYCTNAMELGHVARDANVYLPKFVRAPIEFVAE